MSMKLIIVESPNKIKKVKCYAGPAYEVAASVGHIRDLGGDLGIDREHGHALKYVVSDDKKAVVANLRRLAKAASPQGVYLATDREGEAIAFHLCEVLGLNPRTTKRITFQKITEKAIQAAFVNPTTVDLHLVHAQEGRRAVDRLVAFTLNPVLNRKLAAGLSAGRVRSVAVRLVVERERQIQQFSDTFTMPVVATLQTRHGEQLRARRTAAPFAELDQAQAYLPSVGRGAGFGVLSVEKKPVERQPAPAFSTSTLQQEGVRKLRFTVQQVLDLAQKLFEGRHITYIRTDCVNLGEEATKQAKAQITAQFGADQFGARQTKNKAGAQEVHEAIRPTHWEQTHVGDTPDEQAFYRLIYTRALASQMVAAQYDQTTITLAPAADVADTYASATRVLTRPGYLAVYQEAEEEEEPGDEVETTLKHPVQTCEALTLVKLEARQSFARPAKRYNEATLVAGLEKQGIGRPSTYAAILRKIFARKYISTGSVADKKLTAQVLTWQDGQLTTSQRSETLGADKDKLLPTVTGTQVTEFLERNFPKVLDYKFTAGCEAVFDKIARGQQTYQQFVPMFDQNLLGWVAAADQLTLDRPELQKHLVGHFEGAEMLVGIGKNGPYILHSEKYYNIPESLNPTQLSETQAQDLITQRRASAPRELGLHEGQPVVVGQGPKGVYLKWREQYFNVPAGITAAAVTPALVVNYLIKAQAEAAKNLLATMGKYTVGRNEWGFYVTDGELKAKLKPDCTEEQARATTAEQAADMIKNYKAWKKKNAGRK